LAETSTIYPDELKYCAQRFRDVNIAMLGKPVRVGTAAAEESNTNY